MNAQYAPTRHNDAFFMNDWVMQWLSIITGIALDLIPHPPTG